jgi:hypothetical protein
MDSLEERLKRIRQNAYSSASPVVPAASFSPGNGSHAPASSSSTSHHDEVDDLLRRTSQLVDIERQQGTNSYESDDIDAWLAQESEDEEEATPGPIGQDTIQEVEKESRQLTKEAEVALDHLRTNGELDEAERLLRVEPKPKPVLSRTPTDEDLQTKSLTLEDDLADAMSGELGSGSGSKLTAKDKSPSREVDELTARLALLRSSTKGEERRSQQSRDEGDATFPFDLPSAPSTKPVHLNITASEGDWKEKHGVKDRDLSTYEALVRLNPKKLGPPSNIKKKVADQRGEERDETDDWCCICNEDAAYSCKGCDDDLYCRKCWNEGHLDMDAEERSEHPTKMFVGRRKRKTVTAAM